MSNLDAIQQPRCSLDEGAVWDALKQVMDPELGCNLVDLGLVYGVAVQAGRVDLKLTFTTRGCPMHDSLVGGAEAVIRGLPGVEAVEVEVVWDPPWHPDMMTPEGKAVLGFR